MMASWKELNDFHLREGLSEIPPLPPGVHLENFSISSMYLELAKRVSNFLNINNVLPSGNISKLSVDKLNILLSMGAILILAIDDLNEIVGTMMILPLSVRFQNENITSPEASAPTSSSMVMPIFLSDTAFENLGVTISSSSSSTHLQIGASYTSYLCVHPRFHKTGLVSCLIRWPMVNMCSDFYKVGYYMNGKSRHESSYSVQSWFRVLDYGKAVTSGFLPTSHGNRRENDRQKLLLELRCPDRYVNLKLTDASSLSDLKEWLHDVDFSYYPSTEFEYENHIKGHMSYMILKDHKPICIYMISLNTFFFNETKRNALIADLVFLKFNPNTESGERRMAMKALGFQAKTFGATVLYGYEIGDMTPELMTEFKCQKTSAVRFLEFYNFQKKISLRKSFPLFF